jgi:hypothetical protein
MSAELTSERYSRQKDLVPEAAMKDIVALVIGVGAIGRQVALQLAAVGIRNMVMYDHDTVEESNLASQGYWEGNLGSNKVDCTAAVCRAINSSLIVTARDRKYTPNQIFQEERLQLDSKGDPVRVAVFCCVDSVDTRGAVWKALRNSAAFFVDGRMAAENIRVLASGDLRADDYYETTLFAESEGSVGSCTAKTTIYSANIAAGLMVSQFARWLRKQPIVRDQTLDLLASDFFVG